MKLNKHLFLGALSVMCAAPTGCGGPAKSPVRLNLLLLTLDTLRADRLGCYGYSGAQTPRLDRLASEGARFDQAISPVPLTLPAHATILTGQFPMGHGVRDNGTFRLSSDAVTLAEILSKSGYETAAFVSSFVIDSRFGLSQGFDTYYDFDDVPGVSRQVMRGLSDVQRIGDETARPALQWLSQTAEEPFFLWIHLYDPHSPFEAPEPFGSRFAGRPYDGEVAYTDSVVGKILDHVDTLGLSGTTLIMVAGDHGESLGEHDEEYHSWFIYDATLRVPLLARLPGRIPAGLVIEGQVRLADLAPTALEILGLPGDSLEDMQGTSLAPLVTEDVHSPSPSFAETVARNGLPAYAESLVARLQFGWGELKAIRARGFKYIDAPRPELYDLRKDPGETRDVALEMPEATRRLKEQLDELTGRYERGDADTGARATQIDAETARKLQSLGYVAAPPAADREDSAESSLIDPKDRIADYRDFSNKLFSSMEAIDAGRPAEAVRLLEPLARKLPAHSLVHYHLGQALLHQQELQRAVGELEVALRLSPRFSQARADLADAYIRSGQPAQAVELLQEGLEEEPDNPVLLFNLGFAYHAQKSFDPALQAYRQVNEMERSHPPVLSNLAALYLQTHRPEPAIVRLEELVSVDPRNVMAWNNLGLARAMAGRMEEAGPAFEKAVELAPENPALRKNLANWYEKTGRHKEAQAELQKLQSMESGRRRNP